MMSFKTRAWMNRGSARGDQGNLAAALADFDQAINLDSRNVEAWSNRCGARALIIVSAWERTRLACEALRTRAACAPRPKR
ncbi:MAG: tetratricopeptide repeat protein [Acidobacteria bacterium]|nr:tetratricopeptide repeat protein [Acidobacteriota bacterium]